MSFRGLWISLVCFAVILAAFRLAPDCYVLPVSAVSSLGFLIGGAVYYRDFYLHIKKYKHERDEFNRRLRERG